LEWPSNLESFAQWRADLSNWAPFAKEIARYHSLPCTDLHAFSAGSNLVVALDDALVLKIFPPMLRHQFIAERACLMQLRGRLLVPIPEIVREGEWDQWPYLIITRMKGVMGSEIWPQLPEDDKERVLGQIGELIAEVQQVPVGDLSSLEPRWESFIPKQIEGCRARHERLGLPQNFLDELDEFLDAAAKLIPMSQPPVILTGEYTPENLLLRQDSKGWQLSALIDFGDVMTGWGEYDLLGPSSFMIGGRPGRLRSFFRGFGYAEADLTPALTRRLIALLLLHRYSDPVRQIGIENWQQKAANLGELERLIWPI
jgi:hygromycin-B 7''-O-kinase